MCLNYLGSTLMILGRFIMYRQQLQTKFFFEKDAKNWQKKSDIKKNRLLNTIQERNFFVIKKIKDFYR